MEQKQVSERGAVGCMALAFAAMAAILGAVAVGIFLGAGYAFAALALAAAGAAAFYLFAYASLRNGD